MKATGMTRRIDELGRVVIPKEIRKSMKLKVGDEIEIYTEDGGLLILRKHSRMLGFGDVGQGVVEAIFRSLGGTVLMTDTSKVLYVGGAYHKVYAGQELTHDMESIIEKRRGSRLENENIVDVVRDDTHEYSACYVAPIITGGDLYGSLIILTSKEDITDSMRVLDTAASFLALSIE